MTDREPQTSAILDGVANPGFPGLGGELSNLDLIRSFAVLCVVARHVLSSYGDPRGPIFQPQALGIFGVLVFFVHTSLVLMMSLERHRAKEKTPFSWSYLTFIVRRVARIYPLSILVVLGAFYFLIPYTEPRNSGLLTGGVLASNLLLAQNLVHEPSIIGPLWTLPIEVQMYLFLPLLYLLVRRFSYRALLYGLWPASVVVALARIKLGFLPEILTFLPCFVPGVIAYGLLREKERRALPFWTLPIAVLAILLAYMAGYARFGGQFVLGYPSCLALCFAICFVRDIPSRLAALKTVSHGIAKYSYGIYLFHVPALLIVHRYLAAQPAAAMYLAFVFLTGALSYLGYHLVEAPFIRYGANFARHVSERYRLKKSALGQA